MEGKVLMFSLNGTIFSGQSTLGIGSVGGLGAVPKGSADSCPSGTIEYGSPSMCGSASDYDAYIQSQISGAYGGNKEAAKSYLQTTQYGVENNYGCTSPNVPSMDAAGKPICLHPDDAKKMGLITVCPKGTTTDPKTGSCIKNFSKTTSGGSSAVKPVAPPTTPTTPVEPPPSQSSISPMVIGALLLVAGAVGVVVYSKRKKEQGYSPNEHDEEGY